MEPFKPTLTSEAQPETQNEAQAQQAALQSIKQLGQTGHPTMVQAPIHCLTIIGQIEGTCGTARVTKPPSTNMSFLSW